jgi:5-methylcytosine-specific restriction protein B
VQAAHELDIPLNHLTTVFNHIHGRPYQYWRVGTNDGTTRISHWDTMRDGNVVAIGWPTLGDLSQFNAYTELEQHFKDTLKAEYTTTSKLTAKSKEVRRFVNPERRSVDIETNDIVVAMTGKKVLGVGKVIGDYEFAEGEAFPTSDLWNG